MSSIPVQRTVEPLLRVSDVARELAISRAAAYRLMRNEIPVVRFGPGIVRVRASDLERYVASKVDPHT